MSIYITYQNSVNPATQNQHFQYLQSIATIWKNSLKENRVENGRLHRLEKHRFHDPELHRLKSGIHQLRLVVYPGVSRFIPLFLKVFYIPGSQVVQNFFHQQISWIQKTVSNQKLFVIVKSHIQQFFAIIWVHTTLFVQNRRIACSAIEIGHRDTVASFYWETIFQILRMKCHDPFSWLEFHKGLFGRGPFQHVHPDSEKNTSFELKLSQKQIRNTETPWRNRVNLRKQCMMGKSNKHYSKHLRTSHMSLHVPPFNACTVKCLMTLLMFE